MTTPSGAAPVRYISTVPFSEVYHSAARAVRSAIYLEDREKIQKLQGDFRRLKEEFDRAVDIEVLKNARELGNASISSTQPISLTRP